MSKFVAVVTIRATIEVDAECGEEAANKACKYIQECDFGQLENIDWDVDFVRDEDFNYCN